MSSDVQIVQARKLPERACTLAKRNISPDLILIWRNRISKLDVLSLTCFFARPISLAKACQCYYVEHGTNLLHQLNRVTSALVVPKYLKLSHSGKCSILNVGRKGAGGAWGQSEWGWTVIEKYQSKTSQRLGEETIMLTKCVEALEEEQPKCISFVLVMLPCSPRL